MNRRNALRAMVLTPFVAAGLKLDTVAAKNITQDVIKDKEYREFIKSSNVTPVDFIGDEPIHSILINSIDLEVMMVVFNFRDKKSISLEKMKWENSIFYSGNDYYISKGEKEVIIMSVGVSKKRYIKMESQGIAIENCCDIFKVEDSIVVIGYPESINRLCYDQITKQYMIDCPEMIGTDENGEKYVVMIHDEYHHNSSEIHRMVL